MSEFRDAFEKGSTFAFGLADNYGASVLVAKSGDSIDPGDDTDLVHKVNGFEKVVGKQKLASNIKLGMRLPSFQVPNQSDARSWQFAQFLKSDGRYNAQWQRTQNLGGDFASSDSFVHWYTSSTKPIDSVIEILVVHSASRREVKQLDLHEIFHFSYGNRGWDCDKIFCR